MPYFFVLEMYFVEVETVYFEALTEKLQLVREMKTFERFTHLSCTLEQKRK